MAESPSAAAPISAHYDLHCHILYAWDDGPKTLDDTLRMIERALTAGTTTVVATPHVGRSFRGKEHPATSIPEGVEKLQAELDARDLKIRIVPGAELMLGKVDLSREDGILPEWTYGSQSKYALIESPYSSWPDFGNNIVYQMMRRGVRPIIAHPERYQDVQKNPARLDAAISQGALLQLTAGTIMGQTNKEMQACCFKLLESGAAHLVASDAHHGDHAWPGEAIETVVKTVGTARARQIFETNPRAILEGERWPAQIEPEVTAKPAGLLTRLLGRR